MKDKQKILPRSAVMLAGVVLSLVVGCAEAPSDNTAKQTQSERSEASVTSVGVLELTPNSAYPARSFHTGRVEPARRSDLGFELGGLLRSVSVDEGVTVKAGQVLAELDTDRINAQVREAKARVAQAEAQAGLASSTLVRLVEARDFDGVSAQELDEAKNRSASADAALLAAQAQLRRMQVDVAKMRLTAPYDAVVMARHFDEGQVLSPGQPVIHIQETARLEVRIGIAGSAANELVVGEAYPLLINDHPVTAQLRSVVPIRNAVTRTVDAVFELQAGADGRSDPVSTRAGDLAQLELRKAVDAVGYWVPLTALAEGERGLWTAYVVTRASDDNRYVIESRAVEVLYQDGSRAYVNGALEAGEQLVPSGLNRIVPGQFVRIERDGN